jgi:hypothetical protein
VRGAGFAKRNSARAPSCVIDHGAVLRRHHRRRAAGAREAFGDRRDRRRRRVPGHRARIAETEVDQIVPVDVDDVRAHGAFQREREPTRGLRHPRHRHAPEQVRGRAARGE